MWHGRIREVKARHGKFLPNWDPKLDMQRASVYGAMTSRYMFDPLPIALILVV